MSEPRSNIDNALEMADASKRTTLRKLIVGTAFVAPAVATFALDGLANPAYAIINSTTSGTPI